MAASQSSSKKPAYPTVSRKEVAIAVKVAEQAAIKKVEEKYEAFVDDRKAYSGNEESPCRDICLYGLDNVFIVFSTFIHEML